MYIAIALFERTLASFVTQLVLIGLLEHTPVLKGIKARRGWCAAR